MPKLDVIERKDFEEFLKYIGCIRKRQKGSHVIYTRSGLKRPIVITADKVLSFRVVRSCLRTLNLSVEQFQEILVKSKG